MPPDFIKESELWGPLFALGVFAALLLAAAIVQVVFQIMLKHRLRAAPEALDTQIVASIKGPAVLFIIILGPLLGFITLTELKTPTWDSLDGLDIWARRVWALVVIGEVSYLASHVSQALLVWYIKILAARTSTGLEDKLLPPVRRVLPMTIYALGTLIALDRLDVAISPLLAGFGIGGLAVALAVQPTLTNFFAGTYLVTEGELKEGDFIELDGGPSGYVVDVGWRSTKVRSRFNNLVIIPNSKMADTIVTNYYSPTPAMNVIVTCGVSYDSDLAKVERAVLEVARNVIERSSHAVSDVEPFFGFSEFGDSNIDFFVFLQANDRTGTFTLKSELIKEIRARFLEEGIEINYPVRRLVYPSGNGASPIVGPPGTPPEAEPAEAERR
jgi:small-conductance mechanosensitive channel